MREKVDPYLRPIYDALYDLMDARIVERALQTGEIEIAPLAFMRGRTLSNAVVILDEAQNTTSMQMKMFLTRLGENSRMIVTGDPSQIDLPPGQTSGLAEAVRLLADVEGIGHVAFTHGGRRPPRTRGAHRRGLRRRGAPDARGQAMKAQPSERSRRCNRRRSSRSALWDAMPGAEATVRRALDRGRSRDRHGLRTARSRVLLTDDAAIRAAQRAMARHRQADQRAVVSAAPDSRGSDATSLGDIAIAYETMAREADGRRQAASPTISRISPCTDFCTCWATITRSEREAEAMEALERDDPGAARHARPLPATRPRASG